jgi:TetR/AcrR family transcriptional repressor of nem operon
MAKRPRGTPKTAERILDVAEKLVQARGYNAFSYADIARAVELRKASLHHHYPTKADLGLALLARYRKEFLAALEAIERSRPGAVGRLERYARLYRSVLERDRMCMCGMLASDIATLPRPMRESVAGFFAENEAWLARVLREGRRRGEVRLSGSASATARLVVSSLEGALLVARGGTGLAAFDDVVRGLVAGLRQRPAGARRRAG